MGKSTIKDNGKIYDVDCEQFKYIFPTGVPDNLHSSGGWEGVMSNPDYPENYFEYIDKLDAEIVLLNCHISLLDRLDKEKVLIVYPCEELIPEYLQRYKNRGDNSSFVSYMASEAKGIIEFIDSTDYKKYKVFSKDTYLSDLFERNGFKMKVMTRAELTEQLRRAMDLKVIDAVYNELEGSLVCDLKFVKDNPPEHRITNAESWAEAVLNGEYDLDIDQLQKVCNRREYELEEEKTFTERRGGLSREELEDKIMQGIINGALGIRYAEIAPYSHGYEVTFKSEGTLGETYGFKNRWECYCDLFEIPRTIVSRIENDTQSNQVFGNKAQPLNIHEVISAIDEAEKHKLTTFVPEKDSGLKRRSGYDGHVASVLDVHMGRALDGIAQHHFHGTYSTMTPNKQNELVEALVFLKGFCLDCFYEQNLHNYNGIHPDICKGIVDYLKKHGTDITTQEKLNEWIKANPEKCGKEENRVKAHFNEAHMLYADAYCDFVKLKSVVDEHKGSLKELCTKLGGKNFNGDAFDLMFGVVNVTVAGGDDGKPFVNDMYIDIFDNEEFVFFQEGVSLKYIKDTCAEIGFDVKDLEAKAIGKVKPSLDERISAAKAVDNKEANKEHHRVDKER